MGPGRLGVGGGRREEIPGYMQTHSLHCSRKDVERAIRIVGDGAMGSQDTPLSKVVQSSHSIMQRPSLFFSAAGIRAHAHTHTRPHTHTSTLSSTKHTNKCTLTLSSQHEEVNLMTNKVQMELGSYQLSAAI